MKNEKVVYHIVALLMVLVWGMSFINTRVLLDGSLSPTEIFVYRFLLAYVGLLVASGLRIQWLGWADEGKLLLCGITGGSLFFIAQNTALDLTLMSDVAILVALNPLLTSLLAGAIGEERFTPVMAVGSVLAFVGVGLLTFHDGFVWGNGLAGDFLALLAAAAWAVYSVMLKRLNVRYPTLMVTRKTFFYGLVTALPVMLSQSTFTPLTTLFNPVIAGNLLFLGLVCSMLAFFLWGRTMRVIGAINATNYLYFNPLVSMVAAAIIYDERVGAIGLIGCALILIGILIAERPSLFTVHFRQK